MRKVWIIFVLGVCSPILHSSNATLSEEATVATNRFTLDFLKNLLHNKIGNAVASPVSVYTLLAILQQATGGDTLQEVNNVVHAQPEVTRQAYSALTNSYQGSFYRTTLEYATRAFAGAGFQFNSGFKQKLTSDFHSDIDNVNFADPVNASGHINSWVSQATHQKINEIVKAGDLDALTRLVLVNAIYFQSYWDDPFHGSENKSFSPTNGTEIQVLTMSKVEVYEAGECHHIGAKFVHLDFVDAVPFTALLLLPTEKHGLDALLNRLTPENLTNIFSHSGKKRVTLQFPQFKLESDHDLEGVLKALGLNLAFQPNANFSGMTNEFLQLDKVVQKANILADDNGVTAAAATGFTFFTMSAKFTPPAEDMDFIADHPFLFFIVDRTNHVPLFAGRVANPSLE